MSKLVDSMNVINVDEDLEAHRFDANNLQMSRLDISLQMAASDNLDMDDVNDFDGNFPYLTRIVTQPRV